MMHKEIDCALKRILGHGQFIMGPEVFDLEEKLAELELRVEELEKEKMEFISELYRMENALDSRIDSILNKLN